MGSSKADNQRADANTPPEYFYLLPVNNSDYDFTYKFPSEADKANVDITVTLSPGAANYMHEIKIR